MANKWQDRVHEVVFDAPLREVVTKHLEGVKIDLPTAIENIVADGHSVKVKGSPYYDTFVFSVTIAKDRTSRGGHSYWYYYPELERGYLIALWLFERISAGDVGHLEKNVIGEAW